MLFVLTCIIAVTCFIVTLRHPEIRVVHASSLSNESEMVLVVVPGPRSFAWILSSNSCELSNFSIYLNRAKGDVSGGYCSSLAVWYLLGSEATIRIPVDEEVLAVRAEFVIRNVFGESIVVASETVSRHGSL
jgi:hypothetical protein